LFCFIFFEIKWIDLDPQIIKDLDDMREKCKSALPSNEKNSNTEQRIRPKSSMSSSTTRSSSAAKSSTTALPRPKSSRATRSEKKLVEQQQTLTKKKSKINGNKHHHASVSTIEDNELDEAEETGIRLVEDGELDDDGKKETSQNI
jgi:hypothetical protein